MAYVAKDDRKYTNAADGRYPPLFEVVYNGRIVKLMVVGVAFSRTT